MPRAEILAAIERVRARTGQETFTLAELIAEMQSSPVSYAESTIQHWVTTAEDLEPVERGTYRLRSLGAMPAPTETQPLEAPGSEEVADLATAAS